MLLLVAVPEAQGAYVIQDIGVLPGGTQSRGYGINNLGQVSGYSNTGSGAIRAVLWSSGLLQDLGTLGGTISAGNGLSTGYGTGLAYTGGNADYRAYLWDGSSMQDLGALGGTLSEGRGVNSSGQVTGQAFVAGNAIAHAFLWNGSTMLDLGTLGGTFSAGQGINDSGHAVGWSQTAGNAANHAFLWDGSAMQDLGTLGGLHSEAYAINNAGQITGYSQSAGNAQRAFLWQGGIMQDLGTLGGGSVGRGLNAAGHVVGSSNGAAFVWNGSSMANLNGMLVNGAGWNLFEAWAINDLGQIVGTGTFNGQTRAYLLTPQVPEPGTYALAALGLAAVALKRGKNRRASSSRPS